VFTASSATGLAYMFELLCWAAGNRLPIVMNVATRALGAPWSVWTDHQDAFSVRDTGWLQMFCEDNQEIYDTTLMAYKIAEDPRVYLPVFVNYDGYILSHTVMPVQIEAQGDVQAFLPKLRHHINLADFSNVKGVSPVTTPNPIIRPEGAAPGYMEFRFAMQKAAENAIPIIQAVAQEFEAKFGRAYGNGLYKTYQADDADYLFMAVGSVASELRGVVDVMRAQGTKIGLLSLKLFRPFPRKALVEAMAGKKAVIVFDRDVGYGHEGVLCYELKAALYGSASAPQVKGFIVGLGGRDVFPEDLQTAAQRTLDTLDQFGWQEETEFLGLKLEQLGLAQDQEARQQ
jgi:pyruvate/2-oxoacid:ferredoxin oxidoreductase alpha subunit